MLIQGPRHAHSEGKTGPRHCTHEIIQNHSGPILGKRAAALLEQSRGMPSQNPENAQKLHFCTIQKSQFDPQSPKTTTNNFINLKWVQNSNSLTQNSSKTQEYHNPKSNSNFKLILKQNQEITRTKQEKNYLTVEA